MRYFKVIFLIFISVLFTSYAQQNWKDLYLEAQNHIKAGKLDLAKAASQQALDKAEKDYGKKSEYYAQTLGLMGEIYFRSGDFTKAVELFIKEKDIKRKVLGASNPNYAKTLNNLSSVLTRLGRFTEAEPVLREALKIKIITVGETDSSTALSYQNLGVITQKIGKYSDAEKAFMKACEIRKKIHGEESVQYANSILSLGILQNMLGNYDNAAPNLEKAVAVYRKSLGDSSITTSSAEFQLVKCYMESGKNEKAQPILERVKGVQKQILSSKNPDYIQTLMSLGQLKWSVKDYPEAKQMFEQAKSLVEKYYGNGHPDFANCLYSIGTIDFILNDYQSAYNNISKALKLTEQIYSEDYPDYATRIHTFAGLLQNMKKYDEAEKLYKKAFDLYKQQIRNYFPFLSESEKSKFYFNLKKRFDMFNCYVISRYKENPSLLSDMLANRISTKAILLNSSLKIKNKILGSDNEELIAKYNSWRSIKEEISELYHLSKKELSAKGKNIDSLEQASNELEKEISQNSVEFKNEFIAKRVDWRDICSELADDEAAVEIIRFNFFDKELTDTVLYVALILKKDTKHFPEIVVLKNGAELEQKYIKNYLNSIQFKIQDAESYSKFWEKIDDKIGDKKVIYVSLDGVYNKINISSLQKADNSFVIDSKTIINVSNIFDIKINKADYKKSENKTAALFGNPKYELPFQLQTPDTISPVIPPLGNLPIMKITIAELPGTKLEIETIDKMMKGSKWNSKLYPDTSATEKNLASIKSVGVLHLATHGYFLPDITLKPEDKIFGINVEKAQENPFLRSGLFFAGASNSINAVSNAPEQTRKGILTAYDAMGLDFDNVGILVLSACETGLGEIKNGEGVYGLQRAFQIAGAKTIIMSLWKVKDQTTQELMTEFYKNWLAGEKVHESFRKAQLVIKEKYQNPYFWGGFILIGEYD